MNQGNLKLTVSITDREFTFAYNDLTTNGNWIIHGDYPISLLTKEIIVDVSDKDLSSSLLEEKMGF